MIVESGQRVRMTGIGPFFPSEEAGEAVAEQMGIVFMEEMGTEFENILVTSGISVGSEGTLLVTYGDGYGQVRFDNGRKLDIPLHLLEPA